jgi:multiple sugar transport system substrate-binding protein
MSGKLSPKQIIIIVGGVALMAGVYFLVTSNLRKDETPPEVKLALWGVLDEKQVLQNVVDDYRKTRPNVQITYRRIDPARYERVLLDALASGQGPDIFMINSRSLPQMRTKLANPGRDREGVEQLGLAQFRALYPTVVEQDFVSDGLIYAAPVYLDTLALLYNRNAFDQASVAEPPVTWTDVERLVPFFREQNASAQITKAAAAIGGTERNQKNAADLLALLMMQHGAKMTDERGTRAMFNAGTNKGNAGLRAFNFYLQFANAASPAYTWNADQPNALDSVGSGRVAMVFGYHDDYAALKRKNPLMDIGIAPMPQVEGETLAVNYAKYWGLAASKQSPNAWWAWDFIAQVFANPARAKFYADGARRPPAIRSLISEKLSDPELGVFARQALTARSWYELDEERIKKIFEEAIEAVLQGKIDSARALRQAEDQVTQLMSAFSE